MLAVWTAHYLPAESRDDDAHQRAQQIEEAIGQIGQRGYTQDSTLGQATGVPWHEYRGDRCTILT